MIDNPNELTEMIFGAVKRVGVRALVSKGWGGLGVKSLPREFSSLEIAPTIGFFNTSRALFTMEVLALLQLGLLWVSRLW